jgi:hypothetical protein
VTAWFSGDTLSGYTTWTGLTPFTDQLVTTAAPLEGSDKTTWDGPTTTLSHPAISGGSSGGIVAPSVTSSGPRTAASATSAGSALSPIPVMVLIMSIAAVVSIQR